MKKIISLFLMLFCMAGMLCPASAEIHNPTFYGTGISGGTGDVVTLTVGVRESIPNVGGLNLSCTYDETEMSYVSGSRKLLCTAMKNGDVNTDQAAVGKVSLLWSSNDGATVSGDIVSFQFIIHKGSASLRIRINEMFKNDANYTDLINAVLVIKPDGTVTENKAVTDVIAKINAIGTVENTAACKTKIEAARKAYNALTDAQRVGVTNYAILTAAELEYDRLQTGTADATAQINAFKEKYKTILSKTLQTVTAADNAAVVSAIADWNALSTNAKLRLVAEKNLLNSLLAKTEELLLTEQEKQEILKEAQAYLDEYKKTYAYLINLPYEDIGSPHYESCYTAKNALAEYADMNSQFAAVAAKEITQMDRYYARAMEVKAQEEKLNDPDKLAAEKFQNVYGWILGMAEENVSREDLPDLSVAAYAYSQLSEASKKLLPGAEAHISALIARAEAAVDAPDSPTVPVTPGNSDPQIVTVEKIITQTVEKEVRVPAEQDVKEEKNGAVMLNAVVPGLNPTVWWLVISAGILLVICGVLAFLYFYSKKEDTVCRK